MMNVTFDKIISNDTVYSLVWSGSYEEKSVVIKVVILTSGVHYDINKNVYKNGYKTISKDEALKHFKYNKYIYDRHEFKNKKAMTHEAFMHEVYAIKKLAKYKLAPTVHKYEICKNSNIHYGFLVMDRADCSLKDIILKRNLHRSEKKIVKNMIHKMHNNYDIVHGDLKPSNIGVYLSCNKIKSCVVFDCQKIKYKKDYKYEFKSRIDRDLANYKKHVKKNKKDRQL